MLGQTKHIHLVGIGGIGMSGIAEILLNLGFQVSGSDLSGSDITENLERLGATIYIGHDSKFVENTDVVVTSSAIRPSNPELIAAKAAKIPVIPRAEMLAELMRMKKYSVAVAGSHGKTTTTSVLATVLGAAGFDPTVVVGGRVDSIGSNARLGEGETFVTEADESDGSFLLLDPTAAVVTNIDLEHLDHYAGMEQLKRTFLQFINKVPFYGVCILCVDDENIRAIIPSVRKRLITYGLSKEAEFRATEMTFDGFNTTFTAMRGKQTIGRVTVPLPGRHMVQNALAVVTVAEELEVPFAITAEAIAGFTGVRRRFQRVGEVADILLIDDYGHHPTEIKATLAAAQTGFDRRLVVAFQPHRYTRTRDLFDEFLTTFRSADKLFITDIYAASETPIEGVTAQKLVDGIRAVGQQDVEYYPNQEELLQTLVDTVQPGDLVLTLGAGDLNKLAVRLLAKLKERHE
ncbi:MAG: UDP-N-acetylmuramate--L-alanine ligase [Candidatus Lernaella stagnicola]|nr:UDP-N-acetylmuramate--L-alanine ligase [Candidatus Lernaella stagnicola]